MKLFPRNWFLLALVLALAGVQFFTGRAPSAALREGPLFPELDLRRVAGVRIESAGDGADALFLERTTDGWCVPSAFDHPALEIAVQGLLDGLAALRAENRAANQSTSHARFGVDAAGTRITLTDEGGEPLLDLVQGVPPEARTEAGAGFAGSYVRLAHGSAVYRAPQLAPVALEPRAWFDGQLLAFERAAVTRIAAGLPAEGVRVELTRSADGIWRAAGGASEPVSLVAVERLLDAASALWATEAIGARERPEADAAALPWARLALGLSDAEQASAARELGLVIAGPWTADQRRARAGPVLRADQEFEGGDSPTGWPVALSNLSAERLAAAIRALAAAADAAEPESSKR